MFRVTIQNNWFVPNVVTSRLRIVQNTGSILQSLSANSVVRQLNGFVGGIHISVSPATKDNAMETMYRNCPKINCPNVRAPVNAQPEVTTMVMENRKCQDVQFVGITNKILKISDLVFISFFFQFYLLQQFTVKLMKIILRVVQIKTL